MDDKLKVDYCIIWPGIREFLLSKVYDNLFAGSDCLSFHQENFWGLGPVCKSFCIP